MLAGHRLERLSAPNPKTTLSAGDQKSIINEPARKYQRFWVRSG